MIIDSIRGPLMHDHISRVLFFDSLANFPQYGNNRTIYIARDTSIMYLYIAYEYVEIADKYDYWKLAVATLNIKYGYLYNWYAATDAKGICAINAHLPSKPEYLALFTYLNPQWEIGDYTTIGGKLKETGTDHWNAPNTGATNEFGFNGRAAGLRNGFNGGVFQQFKNYQYLWCDTAFDSTEAYALRLKYDTSDGMILGASKKNGYSIRLIIDSPIEINGNSAVYIGNDLRRYKCCLINGIWYLAENLAETMYRDGSLIPKVTDNAAWAALTTGAMCAYGNDESNAFETVDIETLINSKDILEILGGENIKVGLINKTLTISSPGGRAISDIVGLQAVLNSFTHTSIDKSIAINGSDLSVVRAELELYAGSETELLAAWIIADASPKSSRIFLTGDIIFTENRQFIRAVGLPRIKFEAITAINFYANNYVIDYNNVDFTNIWFRTAGAFYLRLVGGYGTFDSCVWADELREVDGRKKNIVVTGLVSNNTAGIIVRSPKHFTPVASYNGAALIQPFWIDNESVFEGATSRLYIEVLEMSSVFEFARFARVLLTSAVADCPYSVTGDESWFYAPDQALPGFGNISAIANILRTTTVDKFNAARLITDDAVDYVIGMKANGDAVKRSTRSEDWYGIQWDINVSATTCARIGKSELHRELPLQSLMKGCLLSDAGVVNYYLNPLDWTKKADNTASNLTGTDGQVMVEIPSHYRKFENFLSLRKCKISQYALPEFTYVPKFYIGAYEATVQRSLSKLCSVVNPAADYRGGDNNATWDALTKTLLGRPATSISRIDFRTYARNRGSVNWNMLTYDAYKSLFWLYFVEYANLNSQSVVNAAKDSNGFTQGGLGDGVTDIDAAKWNTWNAYNPFVPCGQTNDLGNYSGEVTFSMPAEYDAVIKTTKANRYRGISNPFGHIWKWIDGVNIEIQSDAAGGLSKLYTCSNPANFSNIDYLNYTLLGNMGRIAGYVKEMMFGEIMPSITGGESTTFWCDYGYIETIPASGTNLRGVLFGGPAGNGAKAGFGYSNTINAPWQAGTYVGSRLCFLGV